MASLTWFMGHYRGNQVGAPYGTPGTPLALIRAYLNVCHQVQLAAIHPCDWKSLALPGFVWHPAPAAQLPAYGSIIVWEPHGVEGVAPSCHLAICIYPDTSDLLTFDQGWRGDDHCHVQAHDYAGIAGWHVPNPNREPW